MTNDLLTLVQLATKAGRALGGSWSVDILETARGWFITDMAEADRSFHLPDCPNAEGSEELLLTDEVLPETSAAHPA